MFIILIVEMQKLIGYFSVSTNLVYIHIDLYCVIMVECLYLYLRDYMSDLNLHLLKEELFNERYFTYINTRASIRLYSIRKHLSISLNQYKSPWYLLRDFLQPFYGLYNIGIGLSKSVVYPLLSLFAFVFRKLSYLININMGFIKDNERRENYISGYQCVSKQQRSFTFDIFLDGVTQCVEGVIQIIKTPFTWFVRIPVQSVLTTHKGWQKIGENNGMQSLREAFDKVVADSDRKAIHVLDVLFRMEAKYHKAIKQGQKPNSSDISDSNPGETLVNELTKIKCDYEGIKTIPIVERPYLVRRTNHYIGALIEPYHAHSSFRGAFFAGKLIPSIDITAPLSETGVNAAKEIVNRFCGAVG